MLFLQDCSCLEAEKNPVRARTEVEEKEEGGEIKNVGELKWGWWEE